MKRGEDETHRAQYREKKNEIETRQKRPTQKQRGNMKISVARGSERAAQSRKWKITHKNEKKMS